MTRTTPQDKFIFLSGLLLLGISLFILTFPFKFYLLRWQAELWDLGHFFFFTILTITTFSIIRKTTRFATLNFCYQLFVLGVLLCVLGVLIELLQSFIPGRNASLLDAYRNIIGTFSGLLIIYTSQQNRRKIIYSSIFLAGILICLMPSYRNIIDEINMRTEFPVLADFSNENQLLRWKDTAKRQCSDGMTMVQDKSHWLRDAPQCYLLHNTGTQKYSGVNMVELVSDWTGYSSLNIELMAEEQGSLTLRIHDKKHLDSHEYKDRFNLIIPLRRGKQLIEVPISDILKAPEDRDMDLTQIRAVGIFSSVPHKVNSFAVGRIWLTGHSKGDANNMDSQK